MFCYGHRLTNDKGRCKNLHGHTAKAVISISADSLDEMGMVAHFDALKNTIGKWISENLDHTMLLWSKDPAARLLLDAGEKVFTMNANPTAENIARLIFESAVQLGIKPSAVEVWESETSKASFTSSE